MAGPGLSDDDLREAAAEAGISPQELRHALVEREGGAVATRADTNSVLGPPVRGESASHAESRINAAPHDAIAAVRRSIERQTGSAGHNQGDGQADIVDESTRVTYRIRGEDDGGGGALVRVDVDPSAAKGAAALSATGLGAIAASMATLGWIFSATTLTVGGIGLGALGLFLMVRTFLRLGAATERGRAVASHALMEAEDAAGRSAKALRPGT